jgi:hypothetical protein
MTRKHFRACAQIVASIDNLELRREAACDFASMFIKENPRFDPMRFFKACDVEV